MKNNFITKIIGATLAFAMMIGGAVGINAVKEAKEVNAAGETYNLVTDISNLAVGDSIAIGNGTANGTIKLMSSTQNDNNRGSVDATLTNGSLVLPSGAEVLTLGKNGNYWTLYATISETNGYLYAASSSKNYLRTRAEDSDANSRWEISITNAGVSSITAKGSNTRNQLKNNGSLFACYASGQTAVSIFKLQATNATVEGVSASLKNGDYYIGEKLSASDFNVTVDWSEGDDTNPVSGFTWTVNGVEDGVLEENNTIIVTFDNVSSDPIQLIATHEHGTLQNDPLTAGEAFTKGSALAQYAETSKQYYVFGVVSEIINNALASDSNLATFWLQNGDEPHGFEAYNIHPIDTCQNYSDLQVGAEVLLKCKIKKYNNSTIESGSVGNILSISYTAPVLTGISLNQSEISLETGKSATLTASPIPSLAELGTVTWISSNTSVARVEDGVVTAAIAGSATITAFIDENSNGTLENEEINATCAVTVTAAPAEKVVAVNSISAGDTVFMFATGVSQQFNGIGGTGTSTYGSGVSYTGTPNKDGLAFEVVDGNADDSFAFKFKSGTYADKYIAWNSGNYLIVSDAINDGSSWSVSFDSENNATISNVKNSERVIWWNVANPRFSCYTDKTDGASYKYTQLGKVMSPTAYLESSTTIKTISGTEVEDTISNVALRFGAIVPVSTWASINANWAITDYGVMFARESMLTARSKSSLEEVFRNDSDDVAVVHKQTFVAPVASGDEYYFTARLVLEETDYDTVFYAAPYIVAGGAYYFLQEVHYSVRTLADECLTNGGSSLSQTALTTLKGNN